MGAQHQNLAYPLIPPHHLQHTVLHQLLSERKSYRRFKDEPLTLQQLSHLLWAAQGILPDRRRTAPSAGAVFPFHIFFSLRKPLQELAIGLYEFDPMAFTAVLQLASDVQSELFRAALAQDCILQAPVCLILCADLLKIERNYGKRGRNYLFLEGGHIGQNIYLMATALGLGTVAVGAFDDAQVCSILELPKSIIPVYLFPVGIPDE